MAWEFCFKNHLKFSGHARLGFSFEVIFFYHDYILSIMAWEFCFKNHLNFSGHARLGFSFEVLFRS